MHGESEMWIGVLDGISVAGLFVEGICAAHTCDTRLQEDLLKQVGSNFCCVIIQTVCDCPLMWTVAERSQGSAIVSVHVQKNCLPWCSWLLRRGGRWVIRSWWAWRWGLWLIFMHACGCTTNITCKPLLLTLHGIN